MSPNKGAGLGVGHQVVDFAGFGELDNRLLFLPVSGVVGGGAARDRGDDDGGVCLSVLPRP